jgi:hypothetical protein
VPLRSARHVRLALSLWCGLVAAIVVLARGLPPDAFFVGDPGVKLIVARNSLAHPGRPLDMDLPKIGARAANFMDPFFRVEDGHAFAATPDLFPLLSAPLIALFGLRGAYILPAGGFLLFILATASLGIALDCERSPTMLILVAAIGTPALFYGLEFWEHSVALAIGGIATALVVRELRATRLLASGMLFGITILLRPEAALYVFAVVLGTTISNRSFRLRAICAVLAGTAIAGAPLWAYSWYHSGLLFGAHVAANMSGSLHQWFSTRAINAHSWFGPRNLSFLSMCVCALTLGLASNFVPTVYRRILQATAAVFTLGVAIGAAAGFFPLATVWCAAPVVTLLSCAAISRPRNGRSFLGIVAAVTMLLVWLTAPNDGGGQWGPRYLLMAYIPLAILASDALEDAVAQFGRIGIVAATLLLLTSAFIQRHAYKELRSTKLAYERAVRFIDQRTTAGGYVITDLWWLDQVTAALYPTRTMLFVDSLGKASEAFTMLRDEHARPVYFVRSRSESLASSATWPFATGFVVTGRYDIPERDLTLSILEGVRRD